MPAAVFSSNDFQAKSLVDFGDPALVRDGILERCCRHMRGVRENDVALDRRQFFRELFEQRNESEIGHHDAVFRVIDDPDDLLGKQARVDGVIERADPHDAVPGFEMPPGVPRQRCDAVAELDAVLFQPLARPAARVRAIRRR